MRDSLGEVPRRKFEDDPDEEVVHVNVQTLLKRLADATKLKLDAEVKDPALVPVYRRPLPAMPELDAVTGKEVVTLRPEFYDKQISETDLFRSYCERRKETHHERSLHHRGVVRAKADEQNESLKALRGPEEPVPEAPAREPAVPERAPEPRPRAEAAAQHAANRLVLDGSFADEDSDF